jgi:hypothetical protein
MPLYTYYCYECTTSQEEDYEFERRVKIVDRDEQFCGKGHRLTRMLDFNGSVYAPTSTGGGMKR